MMDVTAALSAAPAPVSYAWDQAAGPEATLQEIEQAYPRMAERGECDEWLRRALDLNDDQIPYPSRRALEALLAAMNDQDIDEFKAANAHRPWLDLYQQINETGPERSALTYAAAQIEKAHRRFVNRVGRPPAQGEYDLPYDSDIQQWVDELGPGARTGRLEDWTRKELCKLLGYLQRDAKDFTDDELRAMALDAHLISRWPGAPSHAQHAARAARGWSDPKMRRQEFLKAARAPYHRFTRPTFAYQDDGARSPEHRLAELEARYPFLARGAYDAMYGEAGGSRLAVIGDALGITRKHDPADEYRPAEDATQKTFVTPLDKRYGDTFRQFGDQFNGMRLTKVVGHANTGTWRQTTGTSYKALGIYYPATGEIHLNPKLDKLLAKAQRGEVTAYSVYSSVHTLTHELTHACSAGNGDAQYHSTTSAEHTVEEAGAEAIARLHTDKLARQMGVWDQPQPLREAANSTSGGSYQQEVAIWLALCSAAAGDLDHDKLAAGGCSEPEHLTDAARDLLITAHTTLPLYDRARFISDRIAERAGIDAERAHAEVQKILMMPKKKAYHWTRRRVGVSWDSFYYEHVEPERDLTADLADTFKRLLSS